jgi:hypothetical protein
MRFLKVLLTSLLLTSPAFGQTGTVTNHAFAIGAGPGTTGYSSLLCTSAQLAVGQAAADPVCQTITGDVTISAGGVTAIGSSKVLNSMLATMAANTTKCNATGSTANPTDCSGAAMRTNLGLVIGTNVEAWDNDLDCLAALATTGTIKRTGTGTCSAGAIALTDLATGTQDTVIGYFGATTGAAAAVPNCANSLTYSTTTHTFGCNSSAGTGTVTSVATAGLASGGPITASGTVTVTGAVKSDQTTATSTSVAVTPAVQQNHPSAVKAWVNFTGSTTNGAQTVNGSYNVTSVSRTSAGNYTVTFAVAFANTSYACISSTYAAGAVNAFGSFSSLATGSINANFVNLLGPSAYDPTLGAGVVCFGSQ